MKRKGAIPTIYLKANYLMNKFVLSFLICLYATTSFSANTLFVKGNIRFTNKEVKVYYDSEKSLNLEKVDAAKFEEPKSKNLNFGFYSGRIWIKFNINNLLENPQFLELKNPLLDKVYLYKKKANGWSFLGRVGDDYKFSERKIRYRFPQFLITEKGAYLLRIDCNGNLLDLKMNLFSASQIKKRDYAVQLFAGMYFGILGIVLLFNVFMYILLRERNNFFINLYVFALILFELGLTGFGFEWFWGNYPFFQNRVVGFTGSVSLLLVTEYVIRFLRKKKFATRTLIFLKSIAFLLIMNLGLSLLNLDIINAFVYITNNLISVVLVIIVIPVSFSAVRNRVKSSRLVLISFIGLSSGVIISNLYYFGLISNVFFDSVNVQFGVLFQTVLLTFALLDGYTIYKDKSNENLKIISELKETQNVKLEGQVNLRTTELVEQKNQLEQVSREVIASINYAHRIQEALIPDAKTFLQNFKKGFLNFRPKEIVSGDFYWSTSIKDKNSKGKIVEKTLMVVGDTNAQGVPGSILSVLALRVIESCVFKDKVTSPGELLVEVNHEFNLLFPKLEENQKEVNGIYCTVCVIDTSEKTIEFAGAMGRIFVRKNQSVNQYHGDHLLLGKGIEKENFVCHTIQLQDGDILYLGTDGYKKQLQHSEETRDLDLIDILNIYAHLPIEEQEEIYLKIYDDMVALNGQLDDFCIIGIQF